MVTHDKNVTGSFCWVELATTDQNEAKAFYGSIFGWNAQDSPMGPGEFYTIFKLDGRDAAAGYTLRPEQRCAGVPPNWILYVAVESADQIAAKSKSLGGKIVAGPFDVMDKGRMAVIQDPTGAHFCVWQEIQHSGIGIENAPGRVVLGRFEYTRCSACFGVLFCAVRLADGEGRKRSLRLPAHQKRRPDDRRSTACKTSAAGGSTPLAAVLSRERC